MRLTRWRLTIATLMIAVAVMAVILVLEMNLYRKAIRLVSERGDLEDYIPSEARMVWFCENVPIVFLVVLFRSYWKFHRKQKAVEEQREGEPIL